ncbi:MAG: PAS domain S-box protein [Candidatus Sumerlaeia bacterium]|nr:PAS domain S-box protein [Candidatus Sumerlaeia bacterium]
MMLEGAGVGAYEYDLVQERAWFSSEYFRMLGYDTQDYAASPGAWIALVHPDDLVHPRSLIAEYRQGARTSHAIRYRMRRADGQWAWILSRGRLSPENLNLLVGVHLDVTTQVRLEEQLADMRAQRDVPLDAVRPMAHRLAPGSDDTRGLLGRAVHQCPVCIFITDAAGRLKYANPCFYSTTGYEPEAVFGRQVRFLKSGIHPPDFYADMWQTLLSGRDWRGELCNRRRDGHLYWVVATISPITNGAGTITHFVAVEKDITEDKRAQEELRASQERFDQLAELTATFIWEVDTEGRYTYLSHVVEQVLGYKPEELVGRVHYYDLHPEAGRKAFKAAADRIVARRQPFTHLTNPARTRDGRIVWLSTSALPLFDDEGQWIGYRGTDTDITAREQLEQSNRLAAVGKAVGGAAHCIRNVLSTMHGSIGMLEAALQQQRIESAAQAHDLLQRSVFRLTQLTSDMVEHSRPRTATLVPADVRKFLATIHEQLRTTFASRGITVQVHLPPDDLRWHIDPYLLERCLNNLAMNAAEAMADGGTLRLSAHIQNSSTPPSLVLEVADTGAGIAPQDIERIFEHYFTTKGSTGTGLGLANVRDFMRLQGGDILVESRVGKGSTFRLILPEHRQDDPR